MQIIVNVEGDRKKLQRRLGTKRGQSALRGSAIGLKATVWVSRGAPIRKRKGEQQASIMDPQDLLACFK